MNRMWTGIISAVVAFSLGAAAMWAYQRAGEPIHLSDRQTRDFLDGMFDQDFFDRTPDPFEEIDRMRQHMNRLFRDDRFASRFDRWLDDQPEHLAARPEMKKVETDDGVDYRIKLGNKDLVDVQVNVENGYVSIEAQARQEDDNRVSQSTFRQHFPVPPDVDPDSVRIERKAEEIVIHFDKLNA